MGDDTVHDPLPIAVRSVYTVRCSCGWTYDTSVEDWAVDMLAEHRAQYGEVLRRG